MKFTYTDPVPNFDRSKVIGPLCFQMQLKDLKETLALEKIAKAKLYNVIVEDDVASRLILDKGRLQYRKTLLPLNKMRSTVIDNRTVQAAEQIVGSGNAALALARITYDQKVAPAMEFTFGHTFICPTMDEADKICYGHLKKEAVTLDGEFFSPSGTLSGGMLAY